VPQAQYLPSALAGLSWAQVAAAMRDPASPVAKDIDGAANMITAAICKLTHGQPAGVCQAAGGQGGQRVDLSAAPVSRAGSAARRWA
jgi:hypothetical protein